MLFERIRMSASIGDALSFWVVGRSQLRCGWLLLLLQHRVGWLGCCSTSILRRLTLYVHSITIETYFRWSELAR